MWLAHSPPAGEHRFDTRDLFGKARHPSQRTTANPLFLSLNNTLLLCGRSALKLAFTKGSTVTDSIRAYADQKLTKPIERHADLLRDGSNSVEVQLKVETRGRHDEKHLGQEEHIAECTVLSVSYTHLTLPTILLV